MQYILSEEEYQELRGAGKCQIDERDEALATKCVKLACSIKITLDWGRWRYRPTPWGCPYFYKKYTKEETRDKYEIQLDEDEYNGDDYVECCDECPVQTICPLHKKWSQ
jgi:hypothetical protein